MMDERDRMVAVAAEVNALRLLQAARAALSGAPHWRRDLSRVVRDIEDLHIPEADEPVMRPARPL